MPMLASAAPEILIAEIAAVTERIRVGSGGVMLPHYSPFKVAETFSILGGLHGDRIDLGIGRAPGLGSRDDVRAPARSPPDVARRLSRAAHRAARLRRERLPGRPPVRPARDAAGRAGQARRLAARLLPAERDLGRRSSACRTRSPTSSIPAAPRTRGSTASASSRAAPRAARSHRLRRGDLRRQGGGGGAPRLQHAHGDHVAAPRSADRVPSVEKALAFFDQPGGPRRRQPARGRRHPETVRAGLEAVAEEYGADEVLVVTITHDHEARKRSYELLAGAFELAAAYSSPLELEQ